jgi:alkylation response protein AidB-like acyl-CoA dehydrogenase
MFEFDSTQQAIAEAIRQFCDREIEPLVPQLESGEVSPFEVMHRLSETFQLEEMIVEPLRKKAERLRQSQAPQHRPQGGDWMGGPAMMAIFARELARVSPGLCLCVTANMGCGATIAARGDADLIERVAIPVLSLRKVGCWGLTESGSGSDAFAMRTTVRIEGDQVVLDGSKTFISNAPAADVFLVYARLHAPAGGESARADKLRIFPVVVERGTTGLSTGPPMEKLGMHAAPTGEIFLEDVRVPRSYLLGDPDAPAREVAEETLAAERAAIVAMCLGVIERCLDDSVAYAMDRIQFGKPIAAFQLIQQKLARMYVARENVSNLMFKLIWLQENRAGTEREVSSGAADGRSRLHPRVRAGAAVPRHQALDHRRRHQ